MDLFRRTELMFTVILFLAGPLVSRAAEEPAAGAEEKKVDPTLLNVGDYLDWEQVARFGDLSA